MKRKFKDGALAYDIVNPLAPCAFHTTSFSGGLDRVCLLALPGDGEDWLSLSDGCER